MDIPEDKSKNEPPIQLLKDALGNVLNQNQMIENMNSKDNMQQ